MSMLRSFDHPSIGARKQSPGCATNLINFVADITAPWRYQRRFSDDLPTYTFGDFRYLDKNSFIWIEVAHFMSNVFVFPNFHWEKYNSFLSILIVMLFPSLWHILHLCYIWSRSRYSADGDPEKSYGRYQQGGKYLQIDDRFGGFLFDFQKED